MLHLWIRSPYREDCIAALQTYPLMNAPRHHISCHQALGGPYTAARTLIQQLVSPIAEHYPHLLLNHAQTLLRIAPTLQRD